MIRPRGRLLARPGPRGPQAPDVTPMRNMLGSLMDISGIAVSDTTASNRVFHAGDLNPQVFLSPPSYPNDATSLQAAPIVGVGNTRKALNRNRI